MFILSYFFLDDFFIRKGLSPNDAVYIPAIAIGSYVLGVLLASGDFLKKKKEEE